jgi:ADP-ribosyl-[dinitrogen reductase] hydrolase
MDLSTVQRDRALGSIIASAAGDALGAPYEFDPPIAVDQPVLLEGGGHFNWAPGEWTDDTSMAICILELLAKGRALGDESTQDELVSAWANWALHAVDVGVQTRTILGSLNSTKQASALEQSKTLHERTGKTAGNGSLMRTGPVALGSLTSAETTAANARAISDLTHYDSDAGDACVLWSLSIRHAILNADLDIRVGIKHLPEERQTRWLTLIDEAEQNEPAFFSKNGWVIHAFQCAWSAIHLAKNAPETQFKHKAQRLAFGLELAVRGGYDTDTVAAIAGSLLGAYYGFSAVPASWRLELHGWPGISELELTKMAQQALNQPSHAKSWPNVKHFDYDGWSGRFELARHPIDKGLWLGGFGSLDKLPDEITAVVSLCRVGTEDVPERIEKRLEVYLLDKPGEAQNLNLGFVFADVADAIKELRDQGHVVYLHCVQSQSRTPSVAAAYAVRHLGQTVEEALRSIRDVLPLGQPIQYFVDTLMTEIEE